MSVLFAPPSTTMPTRVKLLYDIRSIFDSGTAHLSINGHDVGELPSMTSVPAATGAEWVHRSIDIDPALLQAGTNEVHITLDGDVQLDRLQMELSYQ